MAEPVDNGQIKSVGLARSNAWSKGAWRPALPAG
jgi:hypothetical protein